MTGADKMIENREMMVNGSGYYDFTAYLALKDIKEGEIMGVREDYADGDIVTVEKNNGLIEEMLLLKCHDGYASATILREKPPFENAVPVISRQKMYIDAGRLCYVFYDMITGFVKGMPDEEFDKVRGKIGEAIGIGIGQQPEVKEPQKTPHTAVDTEINDKLNELIVKLANETDAKILREGIIRAEAERDIYRELFEKERAGK